MPSAAHSIALASPSSPDASPATQSTPPFFTASTCWAVPRALVSLQVDSKSNVAACPSLGEVGFSSTVRTQDSSASPLGRSTVRSPVPAEDVWQGGTSAVTGITAAPDAGAIIACRGVPACLSYYVNYPGQTIWGPFTPAP